MLRLERLEPRECPTPLSFRYGSSVKQKIWQWPTGTPGEVRQSAELPSVQKLKGETVEVRKHLDAVPALKLDLSRVSAKVVPVSEWTRPLSTSAYYLGTGDDPVSGVLVIREGQEYFAVHELGHAIDHLTGGLKTRTQTEAEWYAWAFHRWVFDGEANSGFDAMKV